MDGVHALDEVARHQVDVFSKVLKDGVSGIYQALKGALTGEFSCGVRFSIPD